MFSLESTILVVHGLYRQSRYTKFTYRLSGYTGCWGVAWGLGSSGLPRSRTVGRLFVLL